MTEYEKKQKRDEEIMQIKAFDMNDLCSVLNINYNDQKKKYYSPIRDEKEPSFAVKQVRGIWLFKDFGTGVGGSNIDLYMYATGVDYVTATKELRDIILGKTPVRQSLSITMPAKKSESKKEIINIKETTDISAPLLQYAKSRGIPEIPNFVLQLNYDIWDKNKEETKSYFGLATKTIAGSYAMRNKYAKAFIGGTSDISHVQRGSDTLVVVEGMFDALTYNQEASESHDFLILNSTVNKDKAVNFFPEYKNIILVMDQDKAGEETKEFFLDALKDSGQNQNVFEITWDFEYGKDFNALHMSGNLSKIKTISI
jgi:hypothetical protein